MDPNNQNKLNNILLDQIDPFAYQKQKYFDEEKLKDLAASIENEGLIEPIVIRPKGDQYELIAGERRFRAVKQYTQLETIHARIIHVDDLQARRISAAVNIQREDFSAIERIEVIVEIIDAYLIGNNEYNAMGNSPETRVHTLLSKLHSDRVSQNRKSTISENGVLLFNKFVKQVEKILKKLSKRLEWQSFYTHDMSLILDICDDIRHISLKNQLNKSQIKSLSDVKKSSPDIYQDIVNTEYSENIQKNDAPSDIPKLGRTVPLKEMSAREIKQLADKITKTKISISRLSKSDYLEFFKEFFQLAYAHSKSSTRIAFLNSDWRNFQGISALKEDERDSILIFDYSKLMSDAGWKITQYIDCPMSSQRFYPGFVSQMQKNRILGVVRRTLIIARK